MLGLPPDYVERAIARALAQAYPWLHKVEKLHDGGMLGLQLPWYPQASNDSQFTQTQG